MTDEPSTAVRTQTSRRARSPPQRVAKRLSGAAAEDLYLQCFQLILWKQCHSLISVHGLPAQLETVIRDLWTLRILPLLRLRSQRSKDVTAETRSFKGWSSQVKASGSDLEGGSSGNGLSHEDGRSSYQAAMQFRISGERLPRLKESLGLLLFGIYLLRLPIGAGELVKWVLEDRLPYMTAVSPRLSPHFFNISLR